MTDEVERSRGIAQLSHDRIHLIVEAQPAIVDGVPVQIEVPIRNVNRTVGTLLGHEVTKQWKGAGLPDGTIDITFTGSAGQSFGAFVPNGMTMRLVGDANDYLGKGLSGGRLVVRPPEDSPFVAEDQTFCVYLATNEDAIHAHAARSGFPATRVVEIKGMLDPTMDHAT